MDCIPVILGIIAAVLGVYMTVNPEKCIRKNAENDPDAAGSIRKGGIIILVCGIIMIAVGIIRIVVLK
ncbi:hypothetical protein [Porcipelethomonas sp.]|uniref:hypothetical protein n=1 Tax=Porcipelethomonas sp. TaxID=2981675 RepID=UPI003EF4C7A6